MQENLPIERGAEPLGPAARRVNHFHFKTSGGFRHRAINDHRHSVTLNASGFRKRRPILPHRGPADGFDMRQVSR
ncbi:hypothetical protein ACFYUD_00690 [Nocardia tengchongensis]|uniref:hypothetical protein n=1 Tax=Nocardia tengchongensis TaxID=2055889 RepID=UPI00369B2ABE